MGTKETKQVLVPSLGMELGTRITEVCDLLETRKNAAKAAGVSPDQIHRWMRGENLRNFGSVVKLCGEKGVSLDWLSTGEGPMMRDQRTGLTPPINIDLLAQVIAMIDGWLEDQGREMKKSKKAQVIAMAYEMISDGPENAIPEDYHNNVIRLLRVAS